METKLKVLLRDFGYEYQGNVLIQKGIRGWSSDRIVGRYRSLFAAADSLNSICGEDYVARWIKITM